MEMNSQSLHKGFFIVFHPPKEICTAKRKKMATMLESDFTKSDHVHRIQLYSFQCSFSHGPLILIIQVGHFDVFHMQGLHWKCNENTES